MSPGQHRAGHGFRPVASPGNAQKDPVAPGEGPKQLPLAAPHNPGQNLPSQGQESANKERALCHPGSTGCLGSYGPLVLLPQATHTAGPQRFWSVTLSILETPQGLDRRHPMSLAAK